MSDPILDTPAERRRLRVREMILSAAERVFAKEGAEGLSIRRLAEAIDYSPAAIYKYFGSKDELVDELKETFFAQILENVHRIFDAARPFADRARDCAATYINIAREKPHHYAAAFVGEALGDGPGEDEPGFEDSNKGQAFSVLRLMVQQGIDQGHFRPELNASITAKSIWASCHGVAMMMTHFPSFPALKPGSNTIPVEDFIEFHADQIVRGLEA